MPPPGSYPIDTADAFRALITAPCHVWLLHALAMLMLCVVLLDLYFIWRRCVRLRRKLSRRLGVHRHGP